MDLTPVWKALDSFWKATKSLFGEHDLLTIVCAFLIVMMTLTFYRLLRSISPALVGFLLLLVLVMLILHWTYTRTEPAFLKPFIDFLAPFFPSSETPKHW
jgi:hypothetical protein